MKLKLITTSIMAMSLMACQVNADNLVNLGVQSVQLVTLNDAQVKKLSDKSCAQMDTEAKIAPENNPYAIRLNNISQSLGDTVNGTKIDYKVYLTQDVNAWAMANGCVRVYSGLMDKMTDNEIQGVVGHELGHVALGHSKKAMQVAYGTQITRGAIVATTNSAIAELTSSQLGDIAEKVINAQFSQKQEREADNYSFDYLVKKGINPIGLATAFEKLGGGEASLLSTHPSSSERSQNIRNKIAQMNQTK